MARTKQITEIVSDDIDGSTKNVVTITFAIEGTSYEIDLGPKNAREMRRQFGVWAEHGRTTKKTAAAKRPAKKKPVSESAAIRQWAGANGIEVPSRGRIPAALVEQYRNA